MKILAVDDDPIILELLKLLLSQTGHKDVTVAGSGFHALEILSNTRESFDCLILDIDMPGMSGIELCSSVRSLKDYARTPVIMLTARSDLPSIAGAFTAGANDYVTKPFDVNDINARLDVACRMSKSNELLPVFQDYTEISDKGAGRHPFNEADPLKLPAESRLVDSFSLGNYLAKLTSSRVKSSVVFALKVANIQSLYSTCTTSQYVSVLSDVSKSIYIASDNSQTLSAYIGNGTFICISAEDILEVQPNIGRKVEDIYDRLSKTHKDKKLRGVSLLVGRAIRPSGSRSHRVKPTIERALSMLDRCTEVRSA